MNTRDYPRLTRNDLPPALLGLLEGEGPLDPSLLYQAIETEMPHYGLNPEDLSDQAIFLRACIACLKAHEH